MELYMLFWVLVGAGVVLAGMGAWQAGRRIRGAVIVRRAAKAIRQAGPLARSVDRIDVGTVTDTGLTTAIKRYTFNLEVWWTDYDGTARHYGPATHVWPNDLADVPARVVKEWATQLVQQAVRWRLGIDPAPEV